MPLGTQSIAEKLFGELKNIVAQVKTEHPKYDHFDRSYFVSMIVLQQFLGQEWLDKHVTGTAAPTDFLQNDWSTPTRKNTHVLRVIQLAELLLNLQYVPNFREVLGQLKKDNIEATFAELEVGRLLVINRAPFRFVKKTGKIGSDYDIELILDGVTICADTKCKLETTARGIDTVIDSLRTARRQLPNDKPGMAFVKVPQTWNPKGDDDSHLKDFEEIAKQFFLGRGAYKGTQHIVAIGFYFSLALEFENTMGIILSHQSVNPRHRHPKNINYNILGNPNKDMRWISIIEACK